MHNVYAILYSFGIWTQGKYRYMLHLYMTAILKCAIHTDVDLICWSLKHREATICLFYRSSTGLQVIHPQSKLLRESIRAIRWKCQKCTKTLYIKGISKQLHYLGSKAAHHHVSEQFGSKHGETGAQQVGYNGQCKPWGRRIGIPVISIKDNLPI